MSIEYALNREEAHILPKFLNKVQEGIEKIVSKSKYPVYTQEEMPINLSEAVTPEYKVEDPLSEKVSKYMKNKLRKIPEAGKNLLGVIFNPQSLTVIYYGTMAGYYYTQNQTDIGVEGLVGALPYFIEGGRHGEENKRTSDLFYTGSALGCIIGGIRKTMIWRNGEAPNDAAYFLPAMFDFSLAAYTLIKRLEIHKSIINKIKSR